MTFESASLYPNRHIIFYQIKSYKSKIERTKTDMILRTQNALRLFDTYVKLSNEFLFIENNNKYCLNRDLNSEQYVVL